MSVTHRRIIRWSLVTVWAAVIFGFSAIPGSNVPGRYGTLAHFVEYAILGGLLYVALRVDLSRGSSVLAAAALASLYGVSDEFHQSFVPLRVPDVRDWVVDTLGAVVGAGFSAMAERALRPR